MSEKIVLPEQPEKPLPSDCCNSGCSPCILDVYEDLMKEWREKCRSLKSGERDEENRNSKNFPVLSQTKYTPFRILSITSVSSDTNFYKFQAVEKLEQGADYRELKLELNLQPSQYLMLQGSDSEKIFTRAYTPVSEKTLSSNGQFHVIMKLYKNGKMSNYLMNLSPGDVTYWRGPYGGFVHTPNKFKRMLMICAGTGVAPMYSLALSIVNAEEDETTLKMLYCCKDEANIFLRKEIHALQSFWNFSATIYLPHSARASLKPLYGEILKTERLDGITIATELNKGTLNDIMVLVCGSIQFCEVIGECVKNYGVGAENIHIF